jgi:hypothetical protein
MVSDFLMFLINHPFLIAKEFEKIPRDGIWIHEGKTLFISISLMFNYTADVINYR